MNGIPRFLKASNYFPFILIFSLFGIISFLQLVANDRIEGSFFDSTKIFFAHLLVYNLIGILIPVFLYLGTRYPLRGEKAATHFLKHLIISISLISLHLFISQVLYHFLWLMPGESFYQKVATMFQKWFHIELLVYWIIVVAVTIKSNYAKANGMDNMLKKLKVKSQNQTLFLELNNIFWIKAYDSYVKIYDHEKMYLKRVKISELEKTLPPDQFQRIHRSIIVNTSKIKAIQPYFNGEQFIIMHNDEKLKLSRTYKQKVGQLISGVA